MILLDMGDIVVLCEDILDMVKVIGISSALNEFYGKVKMTWRWVCCVSAINSSIKLEDGD